MAVDPKDVEAMEFTLTIAEAEAWGDEAVVNLVAAARKFSADTRKKAASSGVAMPDGSFPIPDIDALKRAIQSVGRARDIEAAKRHIKKRARALNQSHLIPDSWRSSMAAAGEIEIPVRVKFVDGAGNEVSMTAPQSVVASTTNIDGLQLSTGSDAFVERRVHTVAHTGYSNEPAPARDINSMVAALSAPTTALLPEEPLPGPSPFTVNDDGTHDGHLALWASCHIGYPGCVTPPREESFDFYNLGDVVTADGRHVPVGKVTIGCGHAGPELDWRTASAHYDHSGTGISVAHAVADRWGIRLPGALVADASGAQIDEVRRSPLSGDWRKINGSLRLVASLGVNVPGFPVPRAMVASGEVESMFVGFSLEDAAALQLEADQMAEELGLDPASAAKALRASLFG